MLSLLPSQWAVVIGAILVYVCGLYLYRIYFSPLSRFPGPKLAAATAFYEGYYDIVKVGQFPWKISEMHRKYGPVVRINPYEVHVLDPDFVDQLFQQGLDKDPYFSASFGVPLAIFGTWSHELHRLRRGAVNKFFSKASIASRTGLIQTKISKLCSHLEAFAGSGEVVQLDAGFLCLTVDIIAEFCYGLDYKYLDVPGFDKGYKRMIENIFGAGAFNRQFPFILTLAQSLPVWLVMRLVPPASGMLRLQEIVRVEAKRMLAAWSPEKTTETREVADADQHDDIESAGISYKTTIFDQILSSRLPLAEKSEERLVQDGQIMMGAGSETTGRTLYLSTVHLLEQPALLARLRQELQQVMPTPASQPSLQQLEQLPFLTAVIKESIRLSGSVVTRLSRLGTATDPIRYKDYVFPPGTPVSITLFDVLMDETIFPEPHMFNPARWLVASQGSEPGQQALKMNTELDKYFVPFSRGARACVGMWLAWAELYLTMAHVHRRFELELFETSVVDVAAACDRFTCFAKPGGHGVRVKVVRVRAE